MKTFGQMKDILIIGFCFMTCFITNTTAQMVPLQQLINDFKVVDSSKYVIKYSLEFVSNPYKPEIKDPDIIVLEIGENISKSYSYSLFKYDSIYTDGIYKGAQALPLLQISVPPVEIFKNYPERKLSVVYRSPFQGPVLMYIEDMVDINWVIHSEKKNILGYPCQKVTTNFRGRSWEAWFTMEIPVSDGPWKFRGLPGLILQVFDDKGHYSFDCISIKKMETPMKMWDWRYETTSREKLNAFLKKSYQNPADYMKSAGSGVVFVGKSEAESKNISFPFNPIELE